jgi:two-component system LytT family response regulator
MINAIIVDDEKKSRIALQNLVHEFCADVKINDLCESVEIAIKAIEKHKPQLVFLDIEMPFQSGFHLFEKIKEPDFDVIFVTAYDHYALQAIKFSAMDYLLKPVEGDELKKAVDKIIRKNGKEKKSALDFELLTKNAVGKSARIAVPTFDGLEMINADDIIKCVSDDCYTYIFRVDGKKITVSRILKDYEELLGGYNFLRIHHSCLVNLKHVIKYIKGDGGYVIMSNGETCEVSRRKKTELISRLSLLNI